MLAAAWAVFTKLLRNMMTKMAPLEMAQRISQGLLSFPVTHFDAQHHFLPEDYRRHCSWLLERPVAGLFAAGGTGEFFSLGLHEIPEVVGAAVREADGRVPVIAGCGYGTATAVELAQAAERVGADGILLLPPYLTGATQEGLMAHIDTVCKATRLGVIVYNRDNAVLQEDSLESLCAHNPNLVGFKDGVGDIELMMRVYVRLGDRLTYIGGLPTAETFAMPYLEMGITTYSSAIFNFLPDWAIGFYQAVRARDRATVIAGLRDFVLPYIAVRNSTRGYAVSIVKAGMRAIGRCAGPVRPPLTDLSEAETRQLKALIARVQSQRT
jgi:5-dehydro-4-deoxyglucarate dehydratase